MKFTSILFTLATALAATAAPAQTYPTKPVRLIVGFPGSSGEFTARIIGNEISKRLGQQFLVEARAGAQGYIATKYVSDAPADGYILYSGNYMNLSTVLSKDNIIVGGKHLSPIGDFYGLPLYLEVRGSLGPKNLKELIAYSKANPPGKLNWGSNTTTTDMYWEIIKARTGITSTSISYNNVPVAQLLSGEIDLMFASFTSVKQYVDQGKIIALVGTNKLDMAPGVPLASEVGLPPLPEIRGGFWGPPALPMEIRRKLSNEIAAVVKLPELLEQFHKPGYSDVTINTPEEQQKHYDYTVSLLAEAAKISGFKPQ